MLENKGFVQSLVDISASVEFSCNIARGWFCIECRAMSVQGDLLGYSEFSGPGWVLLTPD